MKELELPLYDAFVQLLDIGGEEEKEEVFDAIATIKDDPLTHEDIYRLAKRYYMDNKPLAIQLINTISHNLQYFYGFQAYVSCIKHDEEGIDTMFNVHRLAFLYYSIDGEEGKYLKIMDEIIFSVSEFCPEKTKALIEEMEEAIHDVRTGNVVIVDE